MSGYDLYRKYEGSYLPRFYTDPRRERYGNSETELYSSPPAIISVITEFIQTKNEKLLKKIENALGFIKKYFKMRIQKKLGREFKIPEFVKIIIGKIPVKVMGGITGVRILKPLAAVPSNNEPIIFCDENLEDLDDDELIFWILPHELLHLNGIEDEEFIEKFLINLYDSLGFKEISEKIRKKSGYLN